MFIKKNVFVVLLMAFVMVGCASNAAPEPVDQGPPSGVPAELGQPSETPLPEPTATVVPTATPYPGTQVFPLESLGAEIPWLPLDSTKVPGVNFIAFNTMKPPFNSVAVRQAFSYAIDREKISEMVIKYGAENVSYATVLTPPQTLGRDINGAVGINFNPEKAREIFAAAGYADPSSFPEVTFLVNVAGESAPGAHLNIANAMAEMWQEHLGVTVTVEVDADWGRYLERLANNPPELYRIGWSADYNDPDNFLRELFHSDTENNRGHFSNADFDALVDQAAGMTDPEERQVAYMMAEAILCEQEAALIPLYHSTYNRP